MPRRVRVSIHFLYQFSILYHFPILHHSYHSIFFLYHFLSSTNLFISLRLLPFALPFPEYISCMAMLCLYPYLAWPSLSVLAVVPRSCVTHVQTSSIPFFLLFLTEGFVLVFFLLMSFLSGPFLFSRSFFLGVSILRRLFD